MVALLVEFISTTAAHIMGLIAPLLPPLLPPLEIPDPEPIQPPGTDGITTILSWLKWIGFAVVGGAIIVGGIGIAVALRRGEAGDALPKILWPMAGAIVIGGGIGMVSALMGG